MAEMFPRSPRAAQARIVQLERRVEALEAASTEFLAAYHEWFNESSTLYDDKAYERFCDTQAALKALLREGENG